MAFANVNIGRYASDGTGDPLRTAFDKINHNFSNIATGKVIVNAPVLSVAGRTGNVLLIYTDVIGAASNAYVISSQQQLKNYVDQQIASLNSSVTERSFEIVSTNFNANSGGRYGVNTTIGPVISYLPPVPNTGDAVSFVDAFGSFSSNNLILEGGTYTVMGSAAQTISTDNQHIGVFFNGSEWRIY